MQLGVLLRRYNGKAAAAGWDGDRYAVFEGPDDRLGLVWLSTWDSEKDAREFQRAYARFQTTKLGPDAKALDEIPGDLRRSALGSDFAVVRRGSDVAVVEGFSTEATGPLLERAFKSEKKAPMPAGRSESSRP